MKYLLAAAVAVVGAAVPSAAAILTLESVTANGPSNFTFGYQATLDANEGLRNGDRFVIFDFDGYISGSVTSATPLLAARSEMVSTTPVSPPGFADDPLKANLVFTYFGSGFRITGGPTTTLDLGGLSGRSIFGGRSADGFYARTTKNDPKSGADTPLYTLGAITIPAPAAVPEPAAWAMMLGGFGLLGSAVRRRRVTVRQALA